MTALTFKVFYDSTIGCVNRWVIHNEPKETDDYSDHKAQLGENSLILSMEDNEGLEYLQELVNGITGKNPVKQRWALVDNQGVVVNINFAYKALKAPENHTTVLANTDLAQIGGTYLGGVFTPPVVVVPPLPPEML